ncbi:parthenolide synthase-like [Bidens hawaiensis]|uniref:parthenolide synthase-like n=1 Tax=Bidens hawaiensis TaxID=980011 RepID=UPI00404A0567
MDIFTEWPLTIILGLSILCIFIYTTLTSTSSSKAKLPPSPPKLPILGNVHQLLGKSRHEALWQLSKQYGPVMQINIGSQPFLVISSPDMAKEVLKTQDHNFCSRGRLQATKRFTYNYNDAAFSPHSDHWREMRKLLVTEFLGPKRAKLTNHMLVTEMESVIHSLSLNPPNTEVNLSSMFLEIVKNKVCKVGFGKSYVDQLLKGPSLDFMLDETIRLLNGSIGDSFPWLGYFIDQLSGWNHRLDDGFRNLDTFIDTIIDEHRKNKAEEISDEDKDFVHTVLDMASKENASGYRPSYADLKALMMDIITGGIDSTVLALIWGMFEIIKNPRVMEKLQSEIRNCAGEIQKVEELDTSKMVFLKMVVKESLRLHTPAPYLIPHACLNHTKVSGYDVFPGTVVLVNAWGLARDPSIWGENAKEFYPERFTANPDVDFGTDRFEMLPFGGGRRSCPAKNTAPGNLEFVIGNLLYWFDWKLPSGSTIENLNTEELGTAVLRKKDPLFLVPTKHKTSSSTV